MFRHNFIMIEEVFVKKPHVLTLLRNIIVFLHYFEVLFKSYCKVAKETLLKSKRHYLRHKELFSCYLFYNILTSFIFFLIIHLFFFKSYF
jgi:hypothetical protein